jgi:hypothetical protein
MSISYFSNIHLFKIIKQPLSKYKNNKKKNPNKNTKTPSKPIFLIILRGQKCHSTLKKQEKTKKLLCAGLFCFFKVIE